MQYYPQRRVSRAASWSRRLASFSALLFAVAAVGHRTAMLETPGFIAVLGVVAGLALVALLLAARGFSRLWNHGDVGGRNIAVAVLVASLVLAPFGLALYRAFTLPMLTDVSTDLDDPPELGVAARTRAPGTNPIVPFTAVKKRLQIENYPLVTGRRYDMTFGRVLETVAGMVRERGWQVVSPASDPAETIEATIEATARTTILAFPVDLAIRLTDEETSTYVDMRSASRYGAHDLGDNAARIRDFLAELDSRMSALAGVVPAEPAELEMPEEGPIPAD